MKLKGQLVEIDSLIESLNRTNKDSSIINYIAKNELKKSQLITTMTKEQKELNAIPLDDDLISTYTEVPETPCITPPLLETTAPI